LHAESANTANASCHVELFLWPKVYFEVLDEVALLSFDYLSRHRLYVIFLFLATFFGPESVFFALGDRNLLLWSDLLRLLVLLIGTHVKLRLVCFYKVFAPCLRVEHFSVRRCRARLLRPRVFCLLWRNVPWTLSIAATGHFIPLISNNTKQRLVTLA
jgi:hypothetical protein